MGQPPPRVGLERIAPGEVAGAAHAWRSVAADAVDPHYALTPEWLGAWAVSADPGPLALVRVGDLAVGLLEQRPGGRWIFAGGDASPQRRLLCRRGAEDEAWRALWGWLGDARGAGELEAHGVPVGVPVPRRATLTEQPSFAAGLPESFDAFLQARSPGTRKGLKSKLRRLERAGATVAEVPDSGRHAALDRFVALHRRRAASKGEEHPDVDDRLTALLEALPAEGGIALRLFELRADDDVAGVTVRLDHGGTGYFYNAGIDPDRTELSPGVSLELASIRDAIERGLGRFDFGPGDYRYKRDLGGVPESRFRAVVPRRSLRGVGLRLARAGYARVRR